MPADYARLRKADASVLLRAVWQVGERQYRRAPGATAPTLCGRARGTSAAAAARTRIASRVRSRSTTRSRPAFQKLPESGRPRVDTSAGRRALLRRAGWKDRYQREGTGEWHELPTGGELRARVDSEAVPAGRYQFKSWAEDEAGNRARRSARENGQPMTLRFPLRAATELRSGIGNGALKSTINYGRAPEVRGRLLSADRDPLPLQTVRSTSSTRSARSRRSTQARLSPTRMAALPACLPDLRGRSTSPTRAPNGIGRPKCRISDSSVRSG